MDKALSEKIISELYSWLDTPYKHQHSTKHRGCDCLGLVRGVYREIYGKEPEIPPSYSSRWGEVGKAEPLLEAAERNLISVVDRDTLEVGSVLVFRMRPNFVAKHCGIVSGQNKMIHSYQGAGRVVECDLANFWRRKIVGQFLFPSRG